MSKEVRSVGEHVRKTTRKRLEYRERKRLEKGVRAVHTALYLGNYRDAAEVLDRRVVDPMGITPTKLASARPKLEKADLGYDFFAATHFLEHTAAYIDFFAEADAGVDPTTTSHYRAAGLETSVETAKKRLRNAFLTIENVGIATGLIRNELTNAVPLVGYELEIGVAWKSFDRDLPERVKLWGITEDEDVDATAIQGRPGSGKSASIETLAEDRYAAGHKVIDCLDWKEVENAFYDVRNQREELQEPRRERNLPVWWDEIDDVDEPQVEIMMPLTPALCEWGIPFDVDDDRFVVRPFTIPASDVEKRAFKAMLTHTTTVQSSTLERAFKEVQDIHDWKISDLAACIQEAADDSQVADRMLTNLETLQKSSFIRDRKDEHSIDWKRIFTDTDTITCFSVAGMSDVAEKYMVMLYITRSLMEERETTTANRGETSGLPRLSTLWRELRLICPPESKKTKDPRIRELEGALIDAWGDLSTLHRHDDVELIGDSQHFETQIHSDVRANFGKGITFRNKKPSVRKFWKAYGADFEHAYVRRVATQFQPGDFAFLGDSSVDERTFHSPCYMAPAMSHHIDTKAEDHGFLSRVEYLDREELRPAPWSADLDERFAIVRGRADKVPDRDEPVAYFAYHMIDSDVDGGKWEWTDDVYNAYLAFARREGLEQLSKQNFGLRLSKWYDDGEYEQKQKMVDGDRDSAYFGLELTHKGRDLLTGEGVEGVVAD